MHLMLLLHLILSRYSVQVQDRGPTASEPTISEMNLISADRSSFSANSEDFTSGSDNNFYKRNKLMLHMSNILPPEDATVTNIHKLNCIKIAINSSNYPQGINKPCMSSAVVLRFSLQDLNVMNTVAIPTFGYRQEERLVTRSNLANKLDVEYATKILLPSTPFTAQIYINEVPHGEPVHPAYRRHDILSKMNQDLSFSVSSETWRTFLNTSLTYDVFERQTPWICNEFPSVASI